MTQVSPAIDRPGYDVYRPMSDVRAAFARNFARQIIETTRPFLPAAPEALSVLDVGCGYGHTAVELARVCRQVVGIEPSAPLARAAFELGVSQGLTNLTFRCESLHALSDEPRYDLVVLDNVFEHLDDQAGALAAISGCLKTGGVAFLLMPNKLWPMEVHYNLPFLSYLPLPLANRYLLWTGRGTDYADACHAPTYWRLRRLLDARPELSYSFVLPADVSLATGGGSWLYHAGVRAIRRWPFLWAISKAFLVVAVKHDRHTQR